MREWDDGGGEGLPFEMWERSLVNALNGKRGQAFLRELETELLAMRSRGEGRLLQGYLMADGSEFEISTWHGTPRTVQAPVGCCTLGVMLKKRMDIAKKIVNPEKDNPEGWVNRPVESAHDFPSWLSQVLEIPNCIIAEIGVINDSGPYANIRNETDEARFERMLSWTQRHIRRGDEMVCR